MNTRDYDALGKTHQGLRKDRKLQKNRDFQLVYKHGTYVVNHLCVIYKMPIGQGPTRVGFVTGKKIGCAVQRNRARRLLREVYRLHQGAIKEGFHIVIVGRKAINNLSYQEVEPQVLHALERSHLLKNTK